MEHLFVHIPKNGGTSFRNISALNVHGHITLKKWLDDLIITNPLTAQKTFDSTFKFAVCRNPYDRMVSSYFHHAQLLGKSIDKKNNRKWTTDKERSLYIQSNFKTFNDFCLNFTKFRDAFSKVEWLRGIPFVGGPHFHPQTTWISMNGKLETDFLIRFEDIDNGWKEVSKTIGFSYLSLPRTNTSVRSKWDEYYSTETKKIVYDLFRDDFDLLGYEA